MSYFKLDQVICSWEGQHTLYAVNNAEATDFYLKSKGEAKVSYRLLHNAIGWVLPHEFRLANQQAWYRNLKPILIHNGSTLLFCLFVRHISPKEKIVGFMSNKTVCVQLYSETGLVCVIETIKNYAFPSYQSILTTGSREMRNIMETFPLSVDAKEHSLTLEKFHILLRNLNGRTLTFVVTSQDTVETLKKSIQEKEGIPAEEQRLTSEGRQLEDHQTLTDCHIGHASKIHLLLRLSGGLDPIPFNHMTHEKRVPFSPSAPIWRTVIPGLNLEGTCSNKGCSAFDQRVVIQKGIGSFDIDIDICLSKCPCCSRTAININNAGFYDCLYSIQGIKEGGLRVEPQDTQAPKYEFLTFHRNNIALEKWDQLTITAKKLPLEADPIDPIWKSRKEPWCCTIL